MHASPVLLNYEIINTRVFLPCMADWVLSNFPSISHNARNGNWKVPLLATGNLILWLWAWSMEFRLEKARFPTHILIRSCFVNVWENIHFLCLSKKGKLYSIIWHKKMVECTLWNIFSKANKPITACSSWWQVTLYLLITYIIFPKTTVHKISSDI